MRPAARALERICRQRSVVLGYHGVAKSRLRDDLSLLQVSPSRFRGHLELLLGAGFRFVTLAELAHRAGGGVPEPGMAAITFDDGMRNNHTTALPILSEYGIPATVYVTIGFIGGVSPWVGPAGDGAMMDEPELRELARAGWELGAHTMTHPDLSTSDYDACLREIEDSRKALERIAGVRVETFAYPFGRYGPAALAAARDAAVIAAVTTGSGSWEPYEITRAMIGAIDPLPVVLLKLTDRYEPLLRSPPARLARAASKRLRELLRSRRPSGEPPG
ncbi:MAG TPA: polysaccharide deacetylase family protein [Solirubrobacteraceae bacterium]|jgi:peptidoglycan/xylan/chitin deacetylase (PgdA/CDA1 family)|nr:polysaccharide deacetylase family protein [Solirubrobacteraceae bacterium]